MNILTTFLNIYYNAFNGFYVRMKAKKLQFWKIKTNNLIL